MAEQKLRVLVCGGRDFDDPALLDETLRGIKNLNCIIQGGQRAWSHHNWKWVGADWYAKQWAERQCLPCHTFNAQWGVYGRSAGPIRNGRMLSEGRPDLVIAFPGGRGTADMVRQAREAGVEVREVK